MNPKRREDLRRNWWEETNDPETEGWRESLTNEEQAMVSRGDRHFEAGICRLCQKIIALDRAREHGKSEKEAAPGAGTPNAAGAETDQPGQIPISF